MVPPKKQEFLGLCARLCQSDRDLLLKGFSVKALEDIETDRLVTPKYDACDRVREWLAAPMPKEIDEWLYVLRRANDLGAGSLAALEATQGLTPAGRPEHRAAFVEAARARLAADLGLPQAIGDNWTAADFKEAIKALLVESKAKAAKFAEALDKLENLPKGDPRPEADLLAIGVDPIESRAEELTAADFDPTQATDYIRATEADAVLTHAMAKKQPERLIGVIHDEVIVDLPDALGSEEKSRISEMLTTAMQEATFALDPKPAVINISCDVMPAKAWIEELSVGIEVINAGDTGVYFDADPFARKLEAVAAVPPSGVINPPDAARNGLLPDPDPRTLPVTDAAGVGEKTATAIAAAMGVGVDPLPTIAEVAAWMRANGGMAAARKVRGFGPKGAKAVLDAAPVETAPQPIALDTQKAIVSERIARLEAEAAGKPITLGPVEQPDNDGITITTSAPVEPDNLDADVQDLCERLGIEGALEALEAEVLELRAKVASAPAAEISARLRELCEEAGVETIEALHGEIARLHALDEEEEVGFTLLIGCYLENSAIGEENPATFSLSAMCGLWAGPWAPHEDTGLYRAASDWCDDLPEGAIVIASGDEDPGVLAIVSYEAARVYRRTR